MSTFHGQGGTSEHTEFSLPEPRSLARCPHVASPPEAAHSMQSFDHSLKHLLHHDPADFIRFGLGDDTVTVVEPIPSDLPSRGRDVDGGYRILRGKSPEVAHIEFHRRHQSALDLAIDVAEAQVRLFRRERLRVVSFVWDLYGDPDRPLLEEKTLELGAKGLALASRSVHVRVNLRALRADELLATAPPALWPLVALTRDGATEEGVRKARDAIEARTELTAATRADHLAVLWFVAEAEGVATRIMNVYLSEERLMESELYKSIFAKGEACGEVRGEARGEARAHASTLVRMLTHRLGAVDPALRQRIQTFGDAATLEVWTDEVVLASDEAAVRRVLEKISRALPA